MIAPRAGSIRQGKPEKIRTVNCDPKTKVPGLTKRSAAKRNGWPNARAVASSPLCRRVVAWVDPVTTAGRTFARQAVAQASISLLAMTGALDSTLRFVRNANGPWGRCPIAGRAWGKRDHVLAGPALVRIANLEEG